jgi:hypothetical protein
MANEVSRWWQGTIFGVPTSMGNCASMHNLYIYMYMCTCADIQVKICLICTLSRKYI